MIRYAKRGIAAIVSAAMLFSTYSVPISAYDTAVDTPVFDAADVVEAPVFNEGEGEAQEKYNIEINQGFSLHVKKDEATDGKDITGSPTYMSNFVASKKTYIMIPVKTAEKESVKNWKLYYKKAEKEGDEAKDVGDAILTWEGSEFTNFSQYYDENSNPVADMEMAYVSMSTGPAKGKYNFYLEENGSVVATRKDIDFYETKPLNILAIPVKAYYSVSANVEGGGCPEDKKEGSGVSCDDSLWNGIADKLKTYLLDVYPVSEITVDVGEELDAGNAEYDMCSDDGQRKLWEEACKRQSKDKEGKDKYDIILAFVMYRQDKTGTGQGYTFGKPVNIITLTDKDMLPTVAHEIAHCYGVGDEYDGGSYNYRVNDVPLDFNSAGRDKVDGNTVNKTTEYMFNNVTSYNSDQSKYYWLSGEQYQKKLGETKARGVEAAKVATNGAGTVIYPSLHPFMLSKSTFVQFAEKDGTVYPTISYMGSGYSGDDDYYFTTTVIWDHLFNEFMVKDNKEDASSTSTESVMGGYGVMAEEDDGLDLFYDEDYRFGETRMVEVSGVVEYISPLQATPVVSGLQVDPMFSYDGDLEYIEPLDLDEKDKKEMEDELFVFAAIGKDDKVVMSPVDKEPSIVEFYGGTFNSAMPAPKPVSGMQAQEDKRTQPFCNFSFDAEYPYDNEKDESLTKAFVFMKYKDYDKSKTYTKDSKEVLKYIETPDKIIDGKMDAVETKADHSDITLSWDVAAYDIDGNPMTTGLYTMIYYAPQGDDGEVNYVADGNLDEDPRFHYNAAEGTATFSFNPKDYVDDVSEISPYEYVWVKISDGVNGLDLYSDEYTLTKIPENKKASAKGTFDGKEISLNADITYSKGATYTGKKITTGQIAFAAPEEIVDPEKGTTKKNIVKLTVSGMQVASGTQLMTPNNRYAFSDLFKVSIKPNSTKKVGQTGAFKIKLSLNTKVFNKAGYKGKAKKDRKKELNKLISALNKEIAKEKYEYVIEPVNLTFADSVTIKATYKKQTVKLENNTTFKKQKVIQIKGDSAPYTLKKVKWVKVKTTINGIKKPKTFTIKGGNLKKQFKLTVADKEHQLDCLADIEPAATDDSYKGFFKGKRKEVSVKK